MKKEFEGLEDRAMEVIEKINAADARLVELQ